MSTHADRLQAAERAVVDAAVAERDGFNSAAVSPGEYVGLTHALDARVDRLKSLRASTCPECLGDGRKHTYDANGQAQPWIEDHGVCPACSGTGRKEDSK